MWQIDILESLVCQRIPAEYLFTFTLSKNANKHIYESITWILRAVFSLESV